MEIVKSVKTKQPKTPNFGVLISKILKNMIYANIYDNDTIIARTINNYDIRNYHDYNTIMSPNKLKLKDRVKINKNTTILIDCLIDTIKTDIDTILNTAEANKDNYLSLLAAGMTNDILTTNVYDTISPKFNKCLLTEFSDNSETERDLYCKLVHVLLKRETLELLDIIRDVSSKIFHILKCIAWYVSQMCVYDKKHTITIQNNAVYAALIYCNVNAVHVNKLLVVVENILENKANLRKDLKK